MEEFRSSANGLEDDIANHGPGLAPPMYYINVVDSLLKMDEKDKAKEFVQSYITSACQIIQKDFNFFLYTPLWQVEELSKSVDLKNESCEAILDAQIEFRRNNKRGVSINMINKAYLLRKDPKFLELKMLAHESAGEFSEAFFCASMLDRSDLADAYEKVTKLSFFDNY